MKILFAGAVFVILVAVNTWAWKGSGAIQFNQSLWVLIPFTVLSGLLFGFCLLEVVKYLR